MQRIRFLLILSIFTISLCLPAYAAATSSNAADPLESSAVVSDETAAPESSGESTEIPESSEASESSGAEDLTDPDAEGDGISYESLEAMLMELLGGVNDEADQESEESDLEDQEDLPVLGEVTPYFPALLLAETDQEHFINCLRFDVSVGGSDYTLLFSPSYRDQLYVDAQSRLWNMGTSQIQGLVIEGEFNPYNTTGTLVYLAPCLGNNYSNNYNYGSPNWFREYYWSTSSGYERLTYNDTYVQILVTKSYFPFMVSETLMYIVIFLVGGGVLLCWLNRYSRY